MPYSIAALNQMSRDAFVEALGTVFEETPRIADRTWEQRPFVSVADLHQRMVEDVKAMTPADQIALLQAHPDLGSRVQMADASVQEQAGAGLNQLTPVEYERFQRLNQAYKEQFGFPFIIAVKHHTKDSILAAFEQRLRNTKPEERDRALQEVFEIARLRLLMQIETEA